MLKRVDYLNIDERMDKKSDAFCCSMIGEEEEKEDKEEDEEKKCLTKRIYS